MEPVLTEANRCRDGDLAIERLFLDCFETNPSLPIGNTVVSAGIFADAQCFKSQSCGSAWEREGEISLQVTMVTAAAVVF